MDISNWSDTNVYEWANASPLKGLKKSSGLLKVYKIDGNKLLHLEIQQLIKDPFNLPFDTAVEILQQRDKLIGAKEKSYIQTGDDMLDFLDSILDSKPTNTDSKSLIFFFCSLFSFFFF